MMPMAIEEASHWTVRGRQRALWLLCFLVRYAGEEVTPYLPQLLGSLGEASRLVEYFFREHCFLVCLSLWCFQPVLVPRSVSPFSLD